MNVDEFMERETQLYLNSLVSQTDTKDVTIKIIAAKGGVIESIQAIQAEIGVDLIIAEPKSNSLKEELYLGSTSGSIVKQTKIPVLIVPDGTVFKPFQVALAAFKSGALKKSEMLSPLNEFVKVFRTKVNLLLVKTPSFEEEDGELDEALKSIQNTFTTTENMTTFQGVLEHFQSNNPDLLVVFRRKRGFFQKLWEKNTVLKSEFYTTIPLLVLCGEQ